MQSYIKNNNNNTSHGRATLRLKELGSLKILEKRKENIYIFGIILINLKLFKEPLSFWPPYGHT